jgi:hypothetical protein
MESLDHSKLSYPNYLMLKEYGNIDVAEHHINCYFFSIATVTMESFYRTMMNIKWRGDRYTTRFSSKLLNYLYPIHSIPLILY